MSAHRASRGFTLVELLVALVIAGIVVLLAAGIFGVVGDAGRQLRTARAALDREVNARRWLASAFLSLDVGTEGATAFDGRPDAVVFTTWLRTADGWLEPERIELHHDRRRLVAVSPNGTLVLADGLAAGGASVAFDYLLEPGADATWVRAWSSPVSAPLAVRVRLTRAGTDPGRAVVSDTTLFLIKARG